MEREKLEPDGSSSSESSEDSGGEALLPGVQETSVQLSEDMSRLISEGPLELKPKVQGTPPVQATREQISQLAQQTYTSLTSGRIPGSAQAQQGEALLPGVRETSAQLSEDMSRLIDQGLFELKLKKVPVICCFDRKSQSVQAYDPSKKIRIKKQKLHKDMMGQSFTAAAVNDVIYVLMWNQQVHRLTHSDAGSIWESVAQMMFYHGPWPPVVTFNDTIYVIGQVFGSSSREAERYDPQLDEWIKIPDMKTVKRNHMLAATKGHIYCIGGHDGDKCLTSVERLNPGDQSWSDVAPMKRARDSAVSAVLGSKIFVLGGWDGDRQLSDVECYDPDTNTWTPVVSMRMKRNYFSAVVVNGKIFAVGGDDSTSFHAKEIEMFDPEKKEWEVIERVGNMEIYSPAAVAIKM